MTLHTQWIHVHQTLDGVERKVRLNVSHIIGYWDSYKAGEEATCVIHTATKYYLVRGRAAEIDHALEVFAAN